MSPLEARGIETDDGGRADGEPDDHDTQDDTTFAEDGLDVT